MSVFVIRPCFTTGVSLNVCNRLQHNAGKLCQTRFQQTYNLGRSFKTSRWTRTRLSGRREINSNHDQQEISFVRLWKPFCFTVTVSGVSLAGAAIWQYENVREQAVLASTVWPFHKTPKYGLFRQHMHSWWKNLSAGDKVFAPICAINVLVFLAWGVTAWKPFMVRYFTSGVSSSVLCWPMLLSVFSHYNLLHLGANMFVLHSFAEKAVSVLGKEQFVGVYLTAGVVSSFTSMVYKTLVRSPGVSLGASGAVMCMLGFICSKFPNSNLAIIFLPQYPFEAGTGLKCIIGLDTLGCILRWSFFDHAAHLGGSLFGVMWCHWGHQLIWRKREPLVSAWHQLRGPFK